MKAVAEKPEFGGVYKVIRFDNDYGASLICHAGSYGGNKGLWELALIEFEEGDEDMENFKLIHDDNNVLGGDGDIVGWLNEKEVITLLHKIEQMEKPIKQIVKTIVKQIKEEQK